MKTLLLTLTALVALSDVAGAACKIEPYLPGRPKCVNDANKEGKACVSPNYCGWTGSSAFAVCGCHAPGGKAVSTGEFETNNAVEE